MLKRTVLLYGQSLLLSGVAASLAQRANLQVLQATTWDEARQSLAERVPDVLIFQLTNNHAGQMLPLLLANPQLVLVGLDAECNRAVLVAGREARALTLNQILEIVGAEPSAREGTGAA